MNENHLINTFTQGRNRLLQMARRLLENPEDAEDALQEAFSRLWPRADMLRSESEAAKLATVTVRNISIDQLRRQDEHPKSSVDDQCNNPALVTDADEEMEKQEQYRIVKQLIDQRLTPLQQRILQMHDMEEREYSEIAQQEGMQEAAVRMQLSRARKTIRECYRDYQIKDMNYEQR